MKINNENQARQSIEEWRQISIRIQQSHLRKAIENQELSRMYYEQKENHKGLNRADKIIKILQQRKIELDNEPNG